eukprot:2274142-Amphidinium_carterae.1
MQSSMRFADMVLDGGNAASSFDCCFNFLCLTRPDYMWHAGNMQRPKLDTALRAAQFCPVPSPTTSQLHC